MWRWMAWWGWCRWRATPSTSCSAPMSAMCGCCGAGWTSSRGSSAKQCPHKKLERDDDASSRLQSIIVRSGRVLVGLGRLRLAGTALQRKGFAVIERADAALVETGFLDLQIGAVQRIRRQFLDRKAHGFRCSAEAAIGETSPLLLADGGGEQFGGGIEVERTHGTHGR